MTLLPLSAILNGSRADDHPVALADGTAIPLGKLRADSARLAARLQQDGIRRLGLWYRNGFSFATGLLGAAQAGCAVVLPPSIQSLRMGELAAEWDVLLSDDPDFKGAEILAPDVAPTAPQSFDPAAVAVTVFTSGSTARPKAVTRSLALFEREVATIDALWGMRPIQTHHATVPHHHVYGLVFALLWPLMAGRPFAAVWHEVWETLLPCLGENDVVVSSPAHLGRLGGLSAAMGPAMVFSAGSALSEVAAADTKRAFGIFPTEIYGSTETGAIATRHHCGETPWTPLPGTEITADRDGRLVLRSPWAETSPHRGGDLIALGPDGFTLKGRADRVVKVEGKRVGLNAVEAALRALAAVSDAAVLYLDGSRGEIAAIVVLSKSGRVELAAMGAFRMGRHLRILLYDRLEPLARPRRWRFVSHIPTHMLGKRHDASLGALFDDGGL